MELLGKLGIDGKLLLAQIVNFIILFYVLRRYAYKPVLKLLDERREKIEKGIKESEAAHEKLMSAQESEKKLIDQARKEAQNIIAQAQKVAKQSREEMTKAAQQESARITAQALVNIEEEKKKVMREVREDIATLVLAGVEKIIQAKMDPIRDKEMIQKALEEKTPSL